MKLRAKSVNEVLRYDQHTGQLFWRHRPRALFKDDRMFRSWNTRFEGKEAFASKNNQGYKFGFVFGKGYTAHRIVWLMEHGEWPDAQIDHINGDRTDNRIENLRMADNSENHKNQKRPSTNTSGTVGVYQEKRTGSWVATIFDRGIKHHLGSFKSKDAAIAARRGAEKRFGYHENHGRA